MIRGAIRGGLGEGIRRLEELFFKPEDDRIYAVVRMAFAGVALLNLLSLWPYAAALCSDAGMLDLEIARVQNIPFYLSVFDVARSPTAVLGVFAVTGFSLLMLLLGLGARWAAFWVLVWHVSFMARALIATTGWDQILLSFSFLVLISPLGNRWTLGALWRKSPTEIRSTPVAHYGLLLMRLQVLVVYWQTVLHRVVNADPYWLKGEFLSYFLLSHHARFGGLWILENENLLHLLTHGVQLVEVAIPVLLWKRRTRWWGALLGVLLHGGICVGARGLELFFLTMLMSYTCFLDRTDMDGLEGGLRRLGVGRFARRNLILPVSSDPDAGSGAPLGG